MTRTQLEHIIRAAASIADDDEIVVVENQAIMGQFPDAPEELLRSNEADVFPRNHPDRADLIDGSMRQGARKTSSSSRVSRGTASQTPRRCGNASKRCPCPTR